MKRNRHAGGRKLSRTDGSPGFHRGMAINSERPFNETLARVLRGQSTPAGGAT